MEQLFAKMLIDTHAHLNDERYSNEKLDEIIRKVKLALGDA